MRSIDSTQIRDTSLKEREQNCGEVNHFSDLLLFLFASVTLLK